MNTQNNPPACPSPGTPPLASSTAPRWIALAATGGAASLATITSADAATVQIDLLCNFLGSVTGDSLNADLTGDGIADITFDSVTHFKYFVTAQSRYTAKAEFRIDGNVFGAFVCESTAFCIEMDGYPFVFAIGSSPSTITGSTLVPVTFTDANINGGAETNAALEIRAFADASSHTVELVRLVYDDASTEAPEDIMPSGAKPVAGTVKNGVFTAVPEPSRLALLTLGAAGILARRRRKQAATA